MFKKKKKKEEKPKNESVNTKSEVVKKIETNGTVTTYKEVTASSQYSYSSQSSYQVKTSNHSTAPQSQSLLAQPPSSIFNHDLQTDAKAFTPTYVSPLRKNSGLLNTGYVSPYRSANTNSVFLPSTTTISRVPTSSIFNQPTRLNVVPNSSSPILNTNNSVSSSITPGIPTYDTSSTKRGKVLVINNIKFAKNDERKGAQYDEKSLKDMFKKFDFQVTTKTDLTKKGMVTEIKKFASDKSLKFYNMSIVIIMSHGTKLGNTSTVTQIAGIDNQSVIVEDILAIFSNDQCTHLLGKPKIFIFQCCRGDSESEISTDAVPLNRNSDMLIAFSTIPGFVSYRDPNSGSWYIQTLCEIFKKHARDWDIESMLKKVDEEMSQFNANRQQVSCYECRGFKRCYLFQNYEVVKKIETNGTVTTYKEVTTSSQYAYSSQSSYQVKASNHSTTPQSQSLLVQPPSSIFAKAFTPTYVSPLRKNSGVFNTSYVSPYRSANTNSVFLPSTTSISRVPTSLFSNQPTRLNVIPNSSSPISNTNNSVSSSVTPGIPTYDTSSTKRGKVLVINNIKFAKIDERKGAQYDEKSLKDMFKKFDFQVTTKTDLTKKGMVTEIKKFASDKSLKYYNMSIVIIMSHGTKLGNTSTVTQIAGIDNQSVIVEDILAIFSNDQCTHLLGKPKIFIFQCCRGDSESEISTDAVPLNRNSDMLIAFSTIPGFVSYRDPNSGSWYIQTLCEIFKKHACDWDIESMLKKVDEEMSQFNANRQQVSCYECRGFKRCYLFQN